MPVETVIALVISGLSMGVAFMSFRRNVNKDNGASIAANATLSADVKYIRQSIDDMKIENKAMTKDFVQLAAKVVEIEASTKSAHKRIDDLTQKGR